MAQGQMDRTLSEVVQTAERILRANAFKIVTTDGSLFPHDKPALSALKDGRLLVCVAKAYTATDRFLNPDQIDRVRDELDAVITANKPERDPRVKNVDKVALILVPGEITIASPEGDIKWVVVEDVEEIPEEMDKVLGWA